MKKYPLSTYLLSKQIKQLIELNKRIDGRDFFSFREMNIKTNVIEKASGSACVELGGTIVVAGIKFELGVPFPDTPDEGVLIVEGEVLPLASLEEEPGPPTEDEIELSRLVDRTIRESKIINLKDLVIKPGEKVLKIFIDFNVINDAGNVIDASTLAAVSALMTTKFPDVNALRESEEASLRDVPVVNMPIRDVPVSITFANLYGKLVVDPTTEEEVVMDSRLTISLNMKNEICSVQKGGSGTIAFNQLNEALKVARRISGELRKKIIDSLGVKEWVGRESQT